MNPAPWACVTVTFMITADASAATPPRPATVSCRTAPAAIGPMASNWPSAVGYPARVSRIRAATTGTSEAVPPKCTSAVCVTVIPSRSSLAV